jgi:uncharacterized protein (UPF0548 family)
MLCLTRPTERRICSYLEHRSDRPFSYSEVGATLWDQPPPGYVVDHHRVQLGTGPLVYDRARAALHEWAMFRVGWAEVRPARPPIAEGTVVAILARGMGAWCLFACRIVRVIEETGPVASCGFAYGTLPGHLLAGEERFLVQWDHLDDSVWYDLQAISRPSGPAGRLAYPLVRRAQRRFAPESLRAMTRAVGAEDL